MNDIKELKKTDEWDLYQRAIDYMSLFNMFEDTDKNYRFYNGDQWQGLIVEGVEPVQINFIQTIVDYKISVINQNLWGIVYSSENFENKEFKPIADELCKLLNVRANKIWERTKMDSMVRNVSLDSCINDEGIIYSYWDTATKQIKNELLNKVDIYYGNENSSDIQEQPYIIIRRRMPVINVREYARQLGVSEEKVNLIYGDNDNIHNAGDNSEYEKEETCTVLTKMWKEEGKVYYSEATQLVQLRKATKTGLTRYQVAHMPWSDKKGFSRGEGVVRNLIPNQIETNKILMRRAVVTKNTAFPQRVVNVDQVLNPNSVNVVGATIQVKGATEDVNRVFTTTSPAQMSTDVQQLQNDLIELTRNLQNAGDISTGSINPEDASGRAILAVQNASQQTLNNQVQALKDFIEQVALNWLELITNYGDNIVLQTEEQDTLTGEKRYINVKVPNSALRNLKASVKVEVTPMSSYDQYAQELSLENLLKEGWFAPDRIEQLELYVNSLPDKSTMPKQRLLEIIKKSKEKQMYIQQLQAQTQLVNQQANQYIQTQQQEFEDNFAGGWSSEEEKLQDADRQAYLDALAEVQAEGVQK